MGFIERKLRDKGNQEFAESRYLSCALAPREASDVVIATCQDLNARSKALRGERKTFFKEIATAATRNDPLLGGSLTLRGSDDRLLLQIAYPNTRYFEKGASGSGGWLGRGRPLDPECGSVGSRVELTLLRWSIDRSTGKMKYKGVWQYLSDELAEALDAAPSPSP